MPSYKLGYWLRVFVDAPDREAACRTRLSVDAVSYSGGSVSDIEFEFEHVSEFDEAGREISRWDQVGEIEPYSFSPELGNTYT
jgi:hypothetical protein